MAHDTKTLLRDGSGITPVPQFFNPTADDFRPLTGVDLGNGRYGADGLIWGKTSGGVYVPVKCNADGAVVTELSGPVTLATAAKQDTLAGLVSTAANQTALQNLIGSLAAAAVTDPAASAALIQLLKGLLKQLQGGGTGAAPVQLTGSKMELYGASLDDRPDATTVPIGATFTIVDASQDFKTWMSNGTNWGEEI